MMKTHDRNSNNSINFVEWKARTSLPFTRFMQAYIPLQVAQWLIKLGLAHVNLGVNVRRESVLANGVSCEWIIPPNCSIDSVLLYSHGGGFVYSLTPPHLKMGTYLAQRMGVSILMVDYRTSPKYPFPAALDDCEAAYLWLMKQGVLPQNIGFAGDSAGGNLTITVLMKLRDENCPLPAAAACLSPVIDLTPEGNLYKPFKDPLLSPKAAKFYNQSYIGNNDSHNPLISPVLGDLRGFSPLLVHAGEDEILRDDAVRIANAAESVGVDVRLEIYPRMWHVWQLYLSLHQAIQSLEDVALFFKTHLSDDT
jgi:acetyl esterase/lipase